MHNYRTGKELKVDTYIFLIYTNSDLHKSHLLLRIGDHDNKRDDEFEQEFEVDQLINHPLYDGRKAF